jgi:hypothetical protein
MRERQCARTTFTNKRANESANGAVEGVRHGAYRTPEIDRGGSGIEREVS